MKLQRTAEDEDNGSSNYRHHPGQPNKYGLNLTGLEQLSLPPGAFLTSWGTIARMLSDWEECDASIYQFIQRLHQCGYNTQQSDSGLLADHPLIASQTHRDILGDKPVGPYIVFPLDQPGIDIIQQVCKRLGLRTKIGPSYQMANFLWVYLMGHSDSQILASWQKFTTALCRGS